MRMNPPAARTLLAAGLATFVLPSCFTAAVWDMTRPTLHAQPLAIEAREVCVATEGDGSVAFAVHVAPFPDEDSGGWLWLCSIDRSRGFRNFVGAVQDGRIRQARLAVLLPAAHDDSDRGRAMLTLSGLAASRDPEDEWVTDGASASMSSACRVVHERWLDPQPTPWADATVELSQRVPSTSFGQIAGAVALTPFSVACDVITSPLQLVGMLVYA